MAVLHVGLGNLKLYPPLPRPQPIKKKEKESKKEKRKDQPSTYKAMIFWQLFQPPPKGDKET